MKRKIILLLLTVLLLQTCSVCALPSDLGDNDKRIDIVFPTDNGSASISRDIFQELLVYLEIVDEKNGFSPSENTVYDNYIRCISKLTGVYNENNSPEKMLSELYTSGYINSKSEKQYVNFDDMIYSMVKIAGFYQKPEYNGGSESLFYSQAKSEGLLYGVSYSKNTNITNAEFSQLVFNLLTCIPKTISSVKDGNVTFSKENTSILENLYDISFVKGVLNGVHYRNLYDGYELSENQAEINRVPYFCEDKSIIDLVGCEVAAFSKIDDNRRTILFCEQTEKNNYVERNSDDVYQLSSSSISFKDENDKRSSIKVKNTMPIILNGVRKGIYSDIDFNFSDSDFKFIDNDEDGICDVLYVWSFKDYVVSYNVGNGDKIYFDYDMKYEGSRFVSIKEDENNSVEIIRDKKKISGSDILAGNVVSIAKSNNKNGVCFTLIYVSNKIIRSAFSSVYSKNAHFYGEIENTSYEFTQSYMQEIGLVGDYKNSKAVYPIPAANYSVFLNSDNKIAFIDENKKYNIGYVMDVFLKTTLDATVARLALYTLDAKRTELTLCDKVNIYYSDYPKGIKMSCEDAIKIYNQIYPDDVGSLVKYELNSKNEITDFYLTINRNHCEPGSFDYPVTLDYKPDDEYKIQRYYGSVLICEEKYVYRANSNVSVIEVPKKKFRNKAEYYSINPVTANGVDYNYYRLSVYNSDDYTNVQVCTHESQGTSSFTTDQRIQSCVVDKVVESIDNYQNSCLKIYYWCEGKYLYCTTDNYDMKDISGQQWDNTTKISQLEKGDVCQFEKDTVNDLKSFRILFRNSDRGDYRILLGDGSPAVNWPFEEQSIYYGKVIGLKEDMLKIDAGVKTETNALQQNLDNRYIYIFDSENQILKKATVDDIRPEDEVFARKRYHAFWDIVIYR